MASFISVVIPVFNEDKNISELYNRIRKVFAAGRDYEIIFVDDGSTDGSFRLLGELGKSDANVKAVKLTRNFGHETATSAGINYATGDAVIVMDADLQHPPEVITGLLGKWEEGYDVVFALRGKRKAGSVCKNLCSKVFYRLLDRFTDVRLPEDITDFMLLDRKAADAFLKLEEKSRFFRAMVSWMGFKSSYVRYEEVPRLRGDSKYGIRKLAGLSVDVITGYSIKPLSFVTYTGFAISGASFAMLLFYLLKTVFCGATMPGYASLIMSILFIGGIQLLSIGIIGQYIGRIYKETQNRPLYIVDELIGIDEKKDRR